jgi:hypothetical protein
MHEVSSKRIYSLAYRLSLQLILLPSSKSLNLASENYISYYNVYDVTRF